MKKTLTIVLAVIAVAAIVVSCVFGSQNGGLQKAKTDAEQALADAKTAAEEAAATAAADLEAAKAEAEKALTEANEAAEAAKADLEQQLADATAAAEATKADLEKQLADAQAAATEAAESAKADADAVIADLTSQLEAAKADVETVTADLNSQLEAVKADAEATKAELEEKVAGLEVAVKRVERALNAAQSNAYIMYASGDWSVQNWGTRDSDDGIIKVEPANVEGEGKYTVSLEFATPAEGLAFAALGIQNGEYFLSNYSYEITAIRVNGEPIEFKKGYTSSDDGKETRVNIYNEWVSDVPTDARRADGDLTDAAPIIVDKEAFASVSKVEVDFTAEPLKAYLMYANGDWTVQNWGTTDSEDGAVKVITAAITGEGSGEVGLEFTAPADGLAFTAVGIKGGEQLIPGYIIRVNGVYLNDSDENILTGKSYTSSDDGKETRANIYNEWVAELPEDARTADGNTEDASPIVVDPALFTGVTSVKVTFDMVKGQPVATAAADEPMSQDEADALKAAGFHAYIGVQGKDTYIFRNAWNDNYGLNDEEHPYFYRLTGWDDDTTADGSADYAGTFVDTEITGDGEYTVSLTTGEKGFGTTEAFNLLFVSTDIPSKLVNDGYLTISDVKTKIGDAASKEYTQIDTEGDYALIKVIDTYNQSADPFGYTVPGADTTISITFTVSGW